MNLRTVLLIGSESADRTAVALAALADCVATHGWSERLRVLGSGIESGAGAVSSSVRDLLTERGFGEVPSDIENLAARRDLLWEADVLVGDSESVADWIFQDESAEGKEVLALAEVAGAGGEAEHDDPSAYTDGLVERLPELLRVLVRGESEADDPDLVE